MTKLTADLSYELAAQARGATVVAGVDEVGRGPLCGPVTAAAVVLDPGRIPAGIADSKTLPFAQRERIYQELLEVAQVSVAHATVEEIDALNILNASHLAMERAVAGLGRVPDHVLVDGNRLPKHLPCSAEALVKGDAKSLSIAAARSRPKWCAIASWWIWRNSIRDMAGSGTQVTRLRTIWRHF